MADDEQALRELAEGWVQYQRLAGGDREQRKALEQGKPASVYLAHEKVRDRIDAGGHAALELVVALLSAAGWDEVGTVAAGPLEDLIHEHGEELIDGIERLAGQDDRFRAALGSVWLISTRQVAGRSRAAVRAMDVDHMNRAVSRGSHV